MSFWALRSALSEETRAAANRQRSMIPANDSTSESAPKPMSAMDPATTPAPTAIAASRPCQPTPSQARSFARLTSRSRSPIPGGLRDNWSGWPLTGCRDTVDRSASRSYAHSNVCGYVGTNVTLSVESGGEAEGLEGGVMVAHVVDLEGGMGDAVLVGEELFEFAPAGVAVFLPADEDVG